MELYDIFFPLKEKSILSDNKQKEIELKVRFSDFIPQFQTSISNFFIFIRIFKSILELA